MPDLNQAIQWHRQNELEKAKAAYHQILDTRHTESFSTAELGRVYYLLGSLNFQQDQFHAATVHLRNAMLLDPQVNTEYNLALALLRLGHKQKACKIYLTIYKDHGAARNCLRQLLKEDQLIRKSKLHARQQLDINNDQLEILISELGDSQTSLSETQELRFQILEFYQGLDLGSLENFEVPKRLASSEAVDHCLDLFDTEQLTNLLMGQRNPQIMERILSYALSYHNFEQANEIAALARDNGDLKDLQYSPGFLLNCAIAAYHCEKVEEADQYLQKSLDLRPDFLAAKWQLSLHTAWQGDWHYASAQKLIRYEIDSIALKKPPGEIIYPTPEQIESEDLFTRPVNVFCEQGFGDAIQFFRYIQHLPDNCNWQLWTPPALKKLFAENCAIPVHGHPEQGPADGDYIALESLAILDPENQLSRPAYLDCEAIAQTGLVGLCTRGNPYHSLDMLRSLPDNSIHEMLNKLDSHGPFVNLSFFNSVPEHPNWADLGVVPKDFYQTAQIIKGLKAVISIDTSIVHLAGALGVPTLLIAPSYSEWRWGTTQNPTYPYNSLDICPRMDSWQDRLVLIDDWLCELKSG